MFWKHIIVAERERALVTRNGRVYRILRSGTHRLFVSPGLSVDLEFHALRNPVFRSRWEDTLLRERPDLVRQHFTIVETIDTQIAMISLRGELHHVLLPGQRRLFWKDAGSVLTEMATIIGDPELPGSMLTPLEPSTRPGDNEAVPEDLFAL
jgi:hypothetical protein